MKIVINIVIIAVIATWLLAFTAAALADSCQTQKIVGRVVESHSTTMLHCWAGPIQLGNGSPIHGGEQIWCDGEETAPGGDMAFVRIQSTGQSNQSIYISHFTNNGWIAPCDTDNGFSQ